MSFNDISKKLDSYGSAAVNVKEEIFEILKQKVGQITTNGISWSQIATTSINSLNQSNYVLLAPKVREFFNEETRNVLKVDKHNWTANQKINFYCLVNKVKNDSVKEHILDKYKLFLLNRRNPDSPPMG